MRIIHFTAADGWRGHEQEIIYLYEAFKDFGYAEDQWIVCRNDSIIKNVALDKGMNVLSYDFKSEYNLMFAYKLSRLSNKLNSDVLILNSSKAHTLGVFGKSIFGLKSKIVLRRTIIKRVDTNFFRKWKYNYKGIDKIICVSQPVVNILKYAVKDESRMCVVGSVTDIHRFNKKSKDGILHKEFNIPLEYKIVGNISAFVAVKDHYTWVDAVEILVNRKIKAKFILVGDGPIEDEIKALVKEKNLTEHIIFTGFRNDVPQLLSEFDLFLFTSKEEATGGVILEAYACHVPAIAANGGGTYEVLIDGETGFLAEVQNANDFANKAEMILNDSALRQKFITNGYQFLIKNFIKEVIGKKMIDELNEVYLKPKTK